MALSSPGEIIIRRYKTIAKYSRLYRKIEIRECYKLNCKMAFWYFLTVWNVQCLWILQLRDSSVVNVCPNMFFYLLCYLFRFRFLEPWWQFKSFFFLFVFLFFTVDISNFTWLPTLAFSRTTSRLYLSINMEEKITMMFKFRTIFLDTLSVSKLPTAKGNLSIFVCGTSKEKKHLNLVQ